MSTRWMISETLDGRTFYRLGWDASVLVAEWVGIATYRSDRSPRVIPHPGADARRVAKIAGGQARALDRALGGGWSFHGAGVAVDGEGILLLGAGGAGKSTVAAACVSSFGDLLADDVAFVDDINGALHLVPGERQHWLTGEDGSRLGASGLPLDVPVFQRGQKRPFAARSIGDRPVSLRLVCEILPDPSLTETSVEGLRGVEAMRMISTGVFLLPTDGSELLAAHFDWVARVAREARTVRIRRPVSVDPARVAATIRRARMASRA